MPELPEVERSRRLLERLLVGQKLARVDVAADATVFGGSEDAPAAFARHVRLEDGWELQVVASLL
jgi:formamidopyrimidine-DNA glycosylase